MFGIGMPELIVTLVVALVVLGPKRLPEVARTIGRAMGELRRQSNDIMDEFNAAARLEEEERRRTRRQAKAGGETVTSAGPPVAEASTPPAVPPLPGERTPRRA